MAEGSHANVNVAGYNNYLVKPAAARYLQNPSLCRLELKQLSRTFLWHCKLQCTIWNRSLNRKCNSLVRLYANSSRFHANIAFCNGKELS